MTDIRKQYEEVLEHYFLSNHDRDTALDQLLAIHNRELVAELEKINDDWRRTHQHEKVFSSLDERINQLKAKEN